MISIFCYAELVFFPSGNRNHRQYSSRVPTNGSVGLGGFVENQYGIPAMLSLS